MAEETKYGQGGARQDTIQALTQKKEALEKARKKSFMREQIIFIMLAGISVVPIVMAFKAQDSKQGYMLFKVGGAMLVGLYPSYLLIRFLISLVTSPKKAK